MCSAKSSSVLGVERFPYYANFIFPLWLEPTQNKNNALYAEEKAASAPCNIKKKIHFLIPHNKFYSENTLKHTYSVYLRISISTLMKRKEKKWIKKLLFLLMNVFIHPTNPNTTPKRETVKRYMRRRQLKVKAFSGLIIAS